MNTKLSVCMVAVYFYPDVGGIQMTLLSLGQHLQKLGVDVTVITRRTHDNPYYEEFDGIHIYRLDIPRGTPRIKAAVQFILGALRIINQQKERCDIVHSHQLVSPTTIGLLAKMLFGKKLVLTPHTPSTAGDVYSLIHKRPLTGKPRLKWMQNSADAVVAISEEIKTDLMQLGFSSDLISYIPNGVDTQRFVPLESSQKEQLRRNMGLPEGPIVLCAGRLIPRKQIDVLIEAFSMLVPELPETVTLVVLGDGEERNKLEELSVSLGISDRVLFKGSVLDTPQHLQVCDVFVIPSSIEGMPIILLEAMSCGLPCIGSRIGGIEDLIEDKRTGLFTISGDSLDLKEKIKLLLSDSGMSLSLGQEARKEIIKNYSMNATAEYHLSIYKQLLDQ